MIRSSHTAIKSKSYKYVYKITYKTGNISWKAVHQIRRKKNIISNSSYHSTERKAAIAVDRYLIENNREPVNILIRKDE